MEWRKLFLIAGILLSILSKWLQLQVNSLWGDLLILPAAIFFVLSILLHISLYRAFLENRKQRQSARLLAVYICAAVLSFQLLTMFTFGRGQSWGGLFILSFLLFAGLSFFKWRFLMRN